ncbi:hypothetical protein IJG79_02660 [Candidatus Saccharibacteria bacterium]|nr:hypothetical protein [Candidatus Saccharibacteria bacterium]
MQKIFFVKGKAITKTQILNDAERQTRLTKSKNKRRLREGLAFRLAKDYEYWGAFIGGCQPVSFKSVPHINLFSIITREMEKNQVCEPCVAVISLNGQNFIFSDSSDQPILFNGHVLYEGGGRWSYHIEDDGSLTWSVIDADADRSKKGEILMTEPIPFPVYMSVEDREKATKQYGRLCNRYHIIPDAVGESR